jgi:hypothetical protein
MLASIHSKFPPHPHRDVRKATGPSSASKKAKIFPEPLVSFCLDVQQLLTSLFSRATCKDCGTPYTTQLSYHKRNQCNRTSVTVVCPGFGQRTIIRRDGGSYQCSFCPKAVAKVGAIQVCTIRVTSSLHTSDRSDSHMPRLAMPPRLSMPKKSRVLPASLNYQSLCLWMG